MKKILQGLLIVSSVALIAAGCNKPEDTTNTPTNNSVVNTNSDTSTDTTTNTSADTTKTFVVEGSNFRFSPAEIRVNEGDTVVINFTNPDVMPHDWVVDEFSARTQILNKDQSESITFVADKKGTFEYYCSVGQHRQMGMKGNLIVE